MNLRPSIRGSRRSLRPVSTAGQGAPLRPAVPRRPSPWLTSRKAWVKDGSSESFSAISSGRYFSSMAAAAARSGSGTGAPAGKERVRVPGSGKSSEAALPPGRLPPGAAGTHPGGSAASPGPGGGRKGARAGGTLPQRPRGADKTLCGRAGGGKTEKRRAPRAADPVKTGGSEHNKRGTVRQQQALCTNPQPKQYPWRHSAD